MLFPHGYIIDLKVLDKREVELKSVNMEKKALENILQRMKSVLNVVEVVTDASASIKKMMSELQKQNHVTSFINRDNLVQNNNFWFMTWSY